MTVTDRNLSGSPSTSPSKRSTIPSTKWGWARPWQALKPEHHKHPSTEDLHPDPLEHWRFVPPRNLGTQPTTTQTSYQVFICSKVISRRPSNTLISNPQSILPVLVFEGFSNDTPNRNHLITRRKNIAFYTLINDDNMNIIYNICKNEDSRPGTSDFYGRPNINYRTQSRIIIRRGWYEG